jgi:hypothetical protein
MKRMVLTLGVMITLAACSDKDVVSPVQPTVSKTVEFRVVPSADYNLPKYNGITAEVKLAVYKQFSNPYSTEVIWDTVIAKQALSNYMNMPNPNVITRTFSGLKENEYRIGVSYSIGYVTAPPLSANQWSAMGELIPQGNNIMHLVPVGL